MIIDLKPITEQLDRIEAKLDKLLNQEEKPIIVKSIEPTQPTEKKITIEDWSGFIHGKTLIELKDGFTYLVPNYQTQKITNDLNITCNGKATIIFGKDYYNQWKDGSEERFIFDLGVWNNKISIENVDIYTGKTETEVQPFWRTLFWNRNAPNQTGSITLKNSNTNLELGLLYSGSQYEYLTVKAENVNFEGVWWQSLKAPNGGGLLSIMRNCNLKQIDPITHFEAELSFNQGLVNSNISFWRIENEANQVGNSCNIVYLDNMTFLLKKNGNKDFSHEIRTIAEEGKSYKVQTSLTEFGSGIISNEVELQAGDIISCNGIDYVINRKDRVDGVAFEKSDYAMEYNFNHSIQEKEIVITIKKSHGQPLLDGIKRKGYIIFKYNQNFITWSDKEPNLKALLLSNPFGVLSYNHKEITADWENVTHDGFYRQSSSGVGFSNGYRLVNCTGFKDQFSPDIPITTI